MFTPKGIAYLKLLKLIPDLEGRELANYLMSHPVIHPRCGRVITSVSLTNDGERHYFSFGHGKNPDANGKPSQCNDRVTASFLLPPESASMQDLYEQQLGVPNLTGCLMMVLSENPGPWSLAGLTTAALTINPNATKSSDPKQVVRQLIKHIRNLRRLRRGSYYYERLPPPPSSPLTIVSNEPSPREHSIRVSGPAPKVVSPETAFWVENWLEGPGTRKLAKWIGVSHMTFDRELLEIARRAKPPEDLSRELQPKWTGDFGIDVTYVPVRANGQYGKKGFITFVDGSGDWQSHGVISNERHWGEVEAIVNRTISFVGYQFKTGFCDSAYVFEDVFATASPQTELFPDLAHVYRNIAQKVPVNNRSSKTTKAPDAGPRFEFLDMVHDLVYPNSKRVFDLDLSRLTERVIKEDKFHKDWAISGLKRLLHQLGSVELSMKFRERSPLLRAFLSGTNGVENSYSLVKPKIKLMKGFPAEQNLQFYLNLMYGYRRLRPYVASELPEHLGKAPLELAGAKDLDLKNVHWLDYLLRP